MMALNADYLCLYSVNVETGKIIDYAVQKEYDHCLPSQSGKDFFLFGKEKGKAFVYMEDLPLYKQRFTRKTILEEIQEHGEFKLALRLILTDTPRNATLKIVPLREDGIDKLFVVVRLWQERQ